jgi:hypothetical protein
MRRQAFSLIGNAARQNIRLGGIALPGLLIGSGPHYALTWARSLK